MKRRKKPPAKRSPPTLPRPKEKIMLRFIAIAMLFLLIAGCGQGDVKTIIADLQTCTRHYAGSLSSGMPASGAITFQIDCAPSTVVANGDAKPLLPAK